MDVVFSVIGFRLVLIQCYVKFFIMSSVRSTGPNE